MSASKLKHVTTTNPTSKESSSSAYTAYNAVDALVAKPVFGSDGAKKWQSFAQTAQKQHIHVHSVAPTAPLKAIDRATGFTSWKEEREYSKQIRQSDEHTKNTTSSVYTNFTQKANHQNEISSKERKRIERRIMGDHQEYFIPSTTFASWKFDYIFTTRMESHGTGYYFDGMDSLKLLKGQILKDDIPASAKVLSTNSSETKVIQHKRANPASNLNNDEKPTSTTATTISTISNNDEEHTKKKKKKAKNLAPIIVNNPNHPLEQIAAILAQRQTSSELSLPMGWEFAKDSITGKNYYFNRTTGERTWEAPPSTQSNVNNSKGTVATTLSSNDTIGPCSSWNVTKDPTTGKEYYYNVETGETSWEKPATFI